MSEGENSMTTTRKPVGLIIAAASLPAFMATLDNLVVTNALPVMQESLDASIEELQWFINGRPPLSFASFILMARALATALAASASLRPASRCSPPRRPRAPLPPPRRC